MSRKRERSPELEEFDDLAGQLCLSLAGRPTFHRLCDLPYVAVVWQVDARHHLLWLSLWFLHSRSASAFFSGRVCFYADPLNNQPCLELAMPHAPVLATICGCIT